MGFHNHLHSQIQENAITETTSSVIKVFGIIGMILSLVGNIQQTCEMYPLFLDKSGENEMYFPIHKIPPSFFFSFFSDLCLMAYGVLSNDLIITVYGGLNSFVIIITMFAIYYKHQKHVI